MTFDWHGTTLELFEHDYNVTITNERAVELPIAFNFLREHCQGPGLEVGNVLSHYISPFPSWHIVDRYEVAEGVHNVNVFDILNEYAWIVSISTIEHIGRDEDAPNAWGAVAALAYLRGLLRDEGKMLVTVGLGQNHVLDRFLLDHDAPFGARRWTTFVRRRGETVRDNEWFEDWPTEAECVYGPTHGANALWVGEW